MKHQIQTPHFIFKGKKVHNKTLFLLFLLMACCILHGQYLMAQNSPDKRQKDLLEQYIQAKGNSIIVFNASNIKQFWIDNSVASRRDSFSIELNKNNKNVFESIPLKIQLINVSITQNCKIEVITGNQDVLFSVLDSQNKVLAKPDGKTPFVEDYIVSSFFHFDETVDSSFYLQFSHQVLSRIDIKAIILSFENNKQFLSHPGTLRITRDMIYGPEATADNRNTNAFSVSGKGPSLFSKSKILVSDNEIAFSAKIKNTGDSPCRVYLGYSPYTVDGKRIDRRSTLFKNSNQLLKVISSNKDSITVDSPFEWSKGCSVAINAKEDLSDFPNTNVIEPSVENVIDNKNGTYEIKLSKSIDKLIAKNTLIRVQSPQGATYLYTNQQVLQPGEEVVFSSKVKKDDNNLLYTPNTLCRGVHYIQPLILMFSIDSKKDSTIAISDFTISY